MNKRNFRLLVQNNRALAILFTLGVLEAFIFIIQMTLLSKVVSQVFQAHSQLNSLGLLLFLLLSIIGLHAILVGCREWAARHVAIKIKAKLREGLLAHLLRLGPSYSKNQQTGELVTVLSEGIERLEPYITRYLPQTAFSIIIPLLILAYTLQLDWISAALFLITGPVIPFMMVMVGSYAEKQTQLQWEALSRMSVHFLDALQGLPTLKLFGRSGTEQERIRLTSENFRDTTLKVLRITFLSGGVLEFLTAVAIGLIAVTLGVRLLNHGIAFEPAFLVLLLAPEFYRPFRELGVQRHAGMEGKVAAKRIYEILETTSPLYDTVEVSNVVKAPLTITLSNLTYTYPGSLEPALHECNLVLPAGSYTALVGLSGAGKSTIVNLLLRFLDPQQGIITANDIPITSFTVETWREQIALVLQHPYLFSGTILDNLKLARPAATDTEVRQAAELAGAAEFISRLARGYATEIGERGTRLSAGQIQRIAIARAFLKDASLLIFDEPTSCLDPESEVLIRQALEHLAQDRTVLLVAHRQNTLARANQVVVLEGGRVVSVTARPTPTKHGDFSIPYFSNAKN
jgi:ATP-binding cassette subfamily C protein CydD